MNLSGHEFQVIFSVLILLALASVALIVDYLKTMNERLRERHVELLARHETVVKRVEEDNTKLLRALAEQSKAFREMIRTNEVVDAELVDEQPRLEHKPVAELPAADAKKEPDFEGFLEELVTQYEAEPANSLNALAEKVGETGVPVGNHPPAVLHQLLADASPRQGLVVSIGINDYLRLGEIHGQEVAERLLTTVDTLMSEVAGDHGFSSRNSDDEFVVYFPGLTGQAAQKKLSETAAKLWDYQMQRLGTFHAVFAWGATEASGNSLRDALALANEQMAETRGSRQAT